MTLLALLQDIPKIIEGVQKLAELLGINPKLLGYVWWALVLVLLVWLATWLKNLLWKNYVKPLRLKPDEKRRLAHRQMFANIIEGKIRDINSNEEWRDNRFAELEAEVEADGERQLFSLNPFRQRTGSGLRREKSLTRAIEMSRERLIQLEGEPGSGKSVALRFVARTLADRASRSRDLKRVIPLYLNLKELSRDEGAAVDQNLIRLFVLKTLNKANDRDVERFLDDEFSRGLEEGTWLFLFDSFDEIPEVLSSTEADEVIKSYADAISDFLSVMNRCRGVVASRHFRGPGQSRWPRFRILPLSEARRLRLIRQALLPVGVEQQLTGHLEMASPELRDMSRNPMLLGLLSEYMRSGNPFPENVHTVLSSYLEHRLDRDALRVERRFGVGAPAVRAAAESAAFCMAADAGLGLSPGRAPLKRALAQYGLEPGGDVDTLLDALTFIKLARADESASSGEKSFTFAHRRFQEYFATCVVLREPDRVSARALLSDARWRETAVVMCQSQSAEVLTPLVEEARGALADAAGAISAAPDSAPGGVEDSRSGGEPLQDFRWPHATVHILSLLQDGFGRRLAELPDDIRRRVGDMLRGVNRRAGQFDRKCVLEVAGAAPAPVLLGLLRDAFTSKSQLLKNIAYRQVARLGEIPDDIASSIHVATFNLALGGRLRRERFATRAHLGRLDKPERFITALNLLLALPRVDLLLHAAALLAWVPVAWEQIHETSFYRGLLGSSGFVGWANFVMRSPAFVPSSILISYVSLWVLPSFAQSSISRRFALLTHFYFRFTFVMIAMLGLIQASFYRGSLGVPGLILFFYLLSWAPSAMLAAWVGQCTGLRYWPVMPLVPLVLAAKNVRRILKRAKDNWIFLTAVPLTAALILALVFSLPKSTADLIFMRIMPLVGLLGLTPLLYQAVLSAKDRIHWHRWAARYPEKMSALEFVEGVAQYRTDAYRLKFIKAVRTQGRLAANQQTDEFLRKLSLTIEAHDRRAERGNGKAAGAPAPARPAPPNDSPADDEFDALYRKHFKERRFGVTIVQRPEILDELTLLLEQVRAGNRESAPQGKPPSAAAPAAETVGAV
jgi:hypothetical protein